ncbi:MAG: non-homologous end-joining DNA ligase [Bacillota bacterium]|jgi:bifunctional non-homologous end joining protein LigD|nr:non-homologous end-joining DNA ligase [Bacillota bacterium]
MLNKTTVIVEGKNLQLSNLDKVLYPLSGFNKAQVINYYSRIAPALLPHLKDRPVTFKRYPDGVLGKFFYQKECPDYRPDWLRTAPVWSESNDRKINFCILNDLPSLVWAVNLAALELHTSLSLARDPLTPTVLVFDLDPGPPATIIECSQVGMWLRDFFEHLGLQSFPKTSGLKGLQVYVPLKAPATYEQTKNFAKACAELLEERHPNLVVSKMNKKLRTGKVFIDWSQNDDHKTTICVYSLRAQERPTVSTPVTWAEVASALAKKDPELLVFDAGQVFRRFERFGDLFAPVLTLKQKLPI